METSVRATWHCGWMSREDWTEGKADLPPRFSDEEPYDLDICPGWLVRQEPIIEGSRAGQAYESGELQTVFPDPSNGIVEAAEVLRQSLNSFSASRLRQKRTDGGQ